MAAGRTGRLYLVPAPLDFGCAEAAPLGQVMPDGTIYFSDSTSST